MITSNQWKGQLIQFFVVAAVCFPEELSPLTTLPTMPA
jgi:hypothetical protein